MPSRPSKVSKAKTPVAPKGKNKARQANSQRVIDLNDVEVDKMEDDPELPIFFWRETARNGYLSQWFYSPFRDPDDPEIVYKTAEHYMMYQKAVLFKDTSITSSILSAAHPRAVKSLGRKVANFDEDKWKAHRSSIVERANEYKFSHAVDEAQGARMREMLLATGTRELVEASPFDRIWGVGFGPDKAAATAGTRENWGLNLLGKALEETRERLRNGFVVVEKRDVEGKV